MIKRIEFKCPECGSMMFGTSNCTAENSGEMVGHCHGYKPDGQRCRFTWTRDNDHEHFHEVNDND